MHRYGLYFHWSWLIIFQTDLRSFLTKFRLISRGFYIFQAGVLLGYPPFLTGVHLGQHFIVGVYFLLQGIKLCQRPFHHFCFIVVIWRYNDKDRLQFPIRSLLTPVVTWMSDSWLGSGMEIRFIDYLNSRLVTTLNYSAIVNLNSFTYNNILVSLKYDAANNESISVAWYGRRITRICNAWAQRSIVLSRGHTSCSS
jgi:hypothetical protein